MTGDRTAMSDTEDPTLAALRERERDIAAKIETQRSLVRLIEAQHAELCAVIEIVQRGGKRKPGPKPRAVSAADEPEPESGEGP